MEKIKGKMNEPSTKLQLIIAVFIALIPTFLVMWNNSRDELNKTVARHEVTLENHELRINLQEVKSEKIDASLEEIKRGITKIQLSLKDKKNKD